MLPDRGVRAGRLHSATGAKARAFSSLSSSGSRLTLGRIPLSAHGTGIADKQTVLMVLLGRRTYPGRSGDRKGGYHGVRTVWRIRCDRSVLRRSSDKRARVGESMRELWQLSGSGHPCQPAASSVAQACSARSGFAERRRLDGVVVLDAHRGREAPKRNAHSNLSHETRQIQRT
jgi:hypothetical protein